MSYHTVRSLTLINGDACARRRNDRATRAIGTALGGSIRIGVASTTTSTQTALSAIASPPERRSVAVEAVGIGFVFLLVGLFAFAQIHWAILPIIACVLGAVVAVSQYRRGNAQATLEYNAAWAKWDRSYMCDRCGNIAML